MRLTDRSVAALKVKPERYEVWEDGRTGFGVRIAPSGRKSWLFMYRFAGKARRMTLGAYPSVGLATARVAFAEAKRKLDHGEDPGVLASAERRAERDASTVSQLINEYLARSAKGLRSSSRSSAYSNGMFCHYGATGRSSRSSDEMSCCCLIRSWIGGLQSWRTGFLPGRAGCSPSR